MAVAANGDLLALYIEVIVASLYITAILDFVGIQVSADTALIYT